jgi:hypothetical protein
VLAFAQEPPKHPAWVTTNSPLPILVDGLAAKGLPANVPLGTQACVAAAQHYTSEGERWLFQGWSHGPETECVTLTGPGVYQALYKHEVLLHLRSTVSGLQRSQWVLHGSPVQVQVPEAVEEEERVRYRFQTWSDGETPFQARNAIAPLKPTTLEAKWVKEYLVKVEGTGGLPLLGSGWQPEGASLVIEAPDVVPGQSKGDRLKFNRWETVGLPLLIIPNSDKPLTTIKVDVPYTLRPLYDQQYLVVARTPFGTLKREWVKEGEEIPLEAPVFQETIPKEERYIFKRWEGQEGLVSPKVSGVVDRPVELKAVYERQVAATVNAPHGSSGAGWHKEGSIATISVPLSAQKFVVLKSRFVSFPGYGSTAPTIQLLMREPTVVTALYRTEVELRVLALLLLLPLAAVILYFANRWVLLLMRGRALRARQLRGRAYRGPGR